MLLLIYGQTYYFTDYAPIDNAKDVKIMKNKFFFTFIPASIIVVPVFFFASGFLSTVSFLQKGDEMFKIKNILMYYGKKILRYLPIHFFIILFALFIVPTTGTGPVWENYMKAIKPCDDHWPSYLFFANNLVPRKFEDKCMPWLWFLPAYIQLSLVLPLFMIIFKMTSKIISTILFSVIFIGMFGLNIALLYGMDDQTVNRDS